MTEAIDQLATALAAAQAEMSNAAFNRINPHFKSQYADLAAIREATIPALTANGLAIVQYTSTMHCEASELLLYTRLMHKSGQFIEGIYPIARGTPQAMGSQLTYARRYSWSAMCGIAADDDDDAEVAEGAAKAGNRRSPEKKSAHKSRKDGDWESLKTEMAEQTTSHGLKTWGVINSERIHSLPDSWQSHFREEYERRMTELREGVTEEGSAVKRQLKASLEAEDADFTP